MSEIIYKAFKTKIYPTKEQKEYFKKCFGISRFAYNWYLSKMENNYKNGIKQSFYNLRKEFSNLRNDEKFYFLNEINPRIIDHSLGQAKFAYDMFFKKVTKYPKFKSKKNSKQSFGLDRCILQVSLSKRSAYKKYYNLFNGYIFYISGKKEICGKMNGYFIKTSENISFLKDKNIFQVNITYDGLNYYVSFSYKEEQNDIYDNHKKDIVGIDLGLKTFAIQSDNKKTYLPKQKILKIEKRIKRLSQILSKKQKDSNNYNKVKTKLNKCYKKITFIMNDFLHKYTTWLCKTYKTIKIEDLNIKSMLKNKRLAKSIAKSCFYKFRSFLEYKSKWYNNDLVIVDRYYPSSKTCHCCRNIKKDLKLSDRVYKCNKCGYENDRDLNAALNIRDWVKK